MEELRQAPQQGQEYEQMDTGEGGVAVSDPTYMEVGAAEGKTFELKQNEAYSTRTYINQTTRLCSVRFLVHVLYNI